MISLFGGIIEINDGQNLEDLAHSMDKTLAIKFLELALENCTDKFTLAENHIIYKSLEKLKMAEEAINKILELKEV